MQVRQQQQIFPVQITTENRNKYLIYMDKQQHRTVALFIQYICQELQIQQWNFHALAYEDAPDRAVETTQALKENDKLLLQKKAQPTCAAPPPQTALPPMVKTQPGYPLAPPLAPPLAHPASSYGRPFTPQLSGLLHGQARPGFPNIARPNLPPMGQPPTRDPDLPGFIPMVPGLPAPNAIRDKNYLQSFDNQEAVVETPNFIAFANNTGIIEDRELMVNKVKQIAVQRGFRLVIPNGRLENKILL